MCYIYKDNQKSAYIQNIYWVYADYIRQLSYERTFSVPSIQERLFSFCKIKIVNSYLILFFIEFFFHFICLFQKSIYLCMCNKQREHMNQFIHIINLAVLHIIIRVVVLKPMR